MTSGSFFEKLKKGMDVEKLPVEELPEKEQEIIKKTRKAKKEAKTVKKQGEAKKKSIKVKQEEPKEKEAKEELTKPGKWLKTEGQLAVDVYQTEREIVIQSPVAGVEPDDLDISLENDMVIIKGCREKPLEENERNYFYRECYWGPFSREVILPEEVDASRIQASMKQGVLTIRIPKIERRAKKKIIVEE